MLLSQLVDNGLLGPFERDMRALPMVNAMNQTGIRVDVDHLLELDSDLGEIIDEVGQEIPFNPMSPKQLAEAIEEAGLDTGKRTKSGGMATDRRSLAKIKDQNPVFGKVLEYREASKLQSAFVRAILDRMDYDTMRLYPNLNMTRVVTGRLAASKPNILAMPSRGELGRRVRDCFVASPGCKLVSIDYSQIELRLLAHESEDAAMIQAFLDGVDVHTLTAAKLFSKPVDQVDPKKERVPAKTVNFGIVYGMGAKALQDELNRLGVKWSFRKCQDTIDGVKYEVFPGVGRLIDSTGAHARRTGESRDMYGRRRLIPEVYSSMYGVQEAGIRQAVNNRIQSGAQGIIKEAMGQLWPVCLELSRQGTWCAPLLQVHDELLFEVDDDAVTYFVPLAQNIMEDVIELRVPLVCDSAVGDSWGEII